MQGGSLALPALAAALLLALPLAAQVRVEVPPPAHADGEAWAGGALPAMPAEARSLRVTLELRGASAANGAEAVLGAEPGAGGPGPDGTAAAFGWDRGEWFVLGGGLRRRFAAAAGGPGAGGRRALTLRVRLGASGAPAGAWLEEGGRPVDFGMAQGELAGWLGALPPVGLWAAARGGAEGVSVTAGWSADGTGIILR